MAILAKWQKKIVIFDKGDILLILVIFAYEDIF